MLDFLAVISRTWLIYARMLIVNLSQWRLLVNVEKNIPFKYHNLLKYFYLL
jgi:hypothetical protein